MLVAIAVVHDGIRFGLRLEKFLDFVDSVVQILVVHVADKEAKLSAELRA